VLPIAIINSSIRIRENIVSIDPLLIFQRISIMKTSMNNSKVILNVSCFHIRFHYLTKWA